MCCVAGGYVFYSSPLEDATLFARYVAPESRFIFLDGQRIHYKDEGVGPTLVLLHGAWSSLEVWEPWVKYMSTFFRVIRVDMPGYGLSHANTQISPPPSFEHLLYQLIRKLDVKKFHLISSDVQADVALRYYEDHPDQVDKMLFIGMRTEAAVAVRSSNSILQWIWNKKSPWLTHFACRFFPGTVASATLRHFYGDEYARPDLLNYHTDLLQRKRGLPDVGWQQLPYREEIQARYENIYLRHNLYQQYASRKRTVYKRPASTQREVFHARFEDKASHRALLATLRFLGGN